MAAPFNTNRVADAYIPDDENGIIYNTDGNYIIYKTNDNNNYNNKALNMNKEELK